MAANFINVRTDKGVSQANYYHVYAFKTSFNLNDVTHVGDLTNPTSAPVGTFAKLTDPDTPNANYLGELGSCDAGVGYSTSDSDGTANNVGNIIGDKKTGELTIPINTPSNVQKAFARGCADEGELNYVFLNADNGDCFMLKNHVVKINKEATGGGTSFTNLTASKEGSSYAALVQDKTLLDYVTFADPVTFNASNSYAVGEVVVPTTPDGSAYECVVAVEAGVEPSPWNAKNGGTTDAAAVGKFLCIVANTDEVLFT